MRAGEHGRDHYDHDCQHQREQEYTHDHADLHILELQSHWHCNNHVIYHSLCRWGTLELCVRRIIAAEWHL